MSVISWGKGQPDYYKSMVASRPIVMTAPARDEEDSEGIDEAIIQQRMLTHKSYEISAGGSILDTNFYTVPSGYSLNVGGGHISVRDSCINRLRLVSGSLELVGDYRFDMRGDLNSTSLAGQQLTSGSVIQAYVYNNDSIESEFSLVITGVLNRV